MRKIIVTYRIGLKRLCKIYTGTDLQELLQTIADSELAGSIESLTIGHMEGAKIA